MGLEGEGPESARWGQADVRPGRMQSSRRRGGEKEEAILWGTNGFSLSFWHSRPAYVRHRLGRYF